MGSFAAFELRSSCCLPFTAYRKRLNSYTRILTRIDSPHIPYRLTLASFGNSRETSSGSDLASFGAISHRRSSPSIRRRQLRLSTAGWLRSARSKCRRTNDDVDCSGASG